MLAGLVLLSSCTSTQVINDMTTSKGFDPFRGIIYNDATELGLDVYSPPDAKNAPVVIFFYGGRWSGGLRPSPSTATWCNARKRSWPARSFAGVRSGR